VRRGAEIAAAALLLAACQGNGSDIGPRLPRQPDASQKVLVLDDQGRGVCGARVGVDTVPPVVTGRNGRSDFFADPHGLHTLFPDARAASATATDRLVAPFGIRAQLPGADVPFAIYLPDTAPSATLTVSTAASSTPAVLDDTAQSGARLLIPAGTSISAPPPSIFVPQVTFRFGRLEAVHLPGDLPVAGTGAWLFGRGFFLDPAVTFAPGVTIEVPDDLGLGTGTATLFHLREEGDWVVAGTGAVSTAGRIRLDNAVTQSGLYSYAVQVPSVATLRGHVVDAKGRSVSTPMVAVDGSRLLADNDGRFTIAAVAATLGDGTPRSAVVEVRGAGSWLPVGTSVTTTTLSPGAIVDLGDVVLDTLPACNVRVLAIRHGVIEPFRRIGLGTLDGLTAAQAIGDANAQCEFDEVPTDFIGFAVGHPIDHEKVFFAQGVTEVSGGRRRFDLSVFYDDFFWFVGTRSSRTIALDRIGGGPVHDAEIVRGSTDGQGASGLTNETGTVFVDRAFDGRATAVVRTTVAPQVNVSAFTIEHPNGNQLEMPLRRALRQPIGAFDRHGTATGPITGFDPAAEQRLRTTRLLELEDWFDDVFAGEPMQTSLPVKVDPTLPAGAFRVGIAVPSGNFAVAQGHTTSGLFTLDSVGIAAGLAVPEGVVTPFTLALDHPANVLFTAPGARGGLDAAFADGDLRFDLAFAETSGRVVDVARGIAGNIAVSGQDVVFSLPPLDGALAGGAWLCAFGASANTGTTAIAQRTLQRLQAGALPTIRFLPLPTITAPVDGAVVSSGGFTVDFALPPGSLYGTIDLHNGGSEDLRWEVVVPPDLTSFRFWQLPTDVPTPLQASRSYTLTVTAYRADNGVNNGSQDPYRDLTTYFYTTGAAERGVTAVSSQTITVNTN
jgi:hypothetical protein